MKRKPPLVRLWDVLRLRTHLVTGALVGFATWLVFPEGFAPSTRALIGWNAGAGLYVVWSWVSMLLADLATLRKRAAAQDEAEWLVLGLAVAATSFSLVAIGIELHSSGGDGRSPDVARLVLAGLTIVVSWLFTNTIIAAHYARLFYGTDGPPAGGLDFPGTPEPHYSDFLYFSFTIGAATQTSDVAITSRTMRRLALAQSILAFIFNTIVLALAINIAASAI